MERLSPRKLVGFCTLKPREVGSGPSTILSSLRNGLTMYNIKDLPHKKEYVEVWKKVLANPDSNFKHWDWSRGVVSGKVLAKEFSDALQKRINIRGGIVFKGRKHDPDWYRNILQSALKLNTPRLIIDWLPRDLEKRFAHRLRKNRI